MAKNKTKWKIEIIVLELVVICALLGVLFLKKVETYKFNQDATYFIRDNEVLIPEGSKCTSERGSSNFTINKPDKDMIETVSLPAYFNNSKKIVILKNLAYFKPNRINDSSYKLSFFTEISFDSEDKMFISRNDNTVNDSGGFLYDGLNTYVVLEDVRLKYDFKNIMLSPLSYIIVEKDNSVAYFDYDSKTYKYEMFDGDVYLEDINQVYKVSLNNDILSCGETVMLRSNLDSYESYFKEVK